MMIGLLAAAPKPLIPGIGNDQAAFRFAAFSELISLSKVALVFS